MDSVHFIFRLLTEFIGIESLDMFFIYFHTQTGIVSLQLKPGLSSTAP